MFVRATCALIRLFRTHFAKIVKGERSKRKSYRCIVRVSRSLEKPDLKRLEDIAPVLLKQKTPVRVAHRYFFGVFSRVVIRV